MNTGLVSVTFRRKSRAEITGLAVKAGLSEIEWGGDVHVPHGDITAAREAAALCREAGVSTYSYGSYYRLPRDGAGFEDVVETAAALGSRAVRIWAGNAGSADTDEALRADMTEALRRNADAAAKMGLSLSFEYHGDTLTDSADSALRLLRECGRGNVSLHWQPNQYEDLDFNVAALRLVAKYVDTVHVFAWEGDKRLPLARHEDAWRRYFDILCELGAPRAALLEFVPNEKEDEVLRDAEALNGWLKK